MKKVICDGCGKKISEAFELFTVNSQGNFPGIGYGEPINYVKRKLCISCCKTLGKDIQIFVREWTTKREAKK